MAPAYKAEELVVVEQPMKEPKSGDIVIVAMGQKVRIREVRIAGDTTWLLPRNISEFDPVVAGQTPGLEYLARVVGRAE
jgi:SOS-response transcriptional repressor LexA